MSGAGRAALRGLAGVAVVAATLAVGMLILVATGGPSRGAALLALAAFVLGFMALRFAAPAARRPWPAVRALLALALVIELFLLASLPWPPGPGQRGPFAVSVVLVIVTGAAMAIAGRAPRATFALTALLAAYAVRGMAQFLVGPQWTPRAWAGPGEAYTLAFFLAMVATFVAAFGLSLAGVRGAIAAARRPMFD